MIPRQFGNFFRTPLNFLRRNFSENSITSVSYDTDKFQAIVDVKNFQPGDISVEVTSNTVTIQGNREEKMGDQTNVSRYFMKKYILPDGYYDMNKVESKLSSDGILTVTAPKLSSNDQDCCRKVTIEQTGKPFST